MVHLEESYVGEEFIDQAVHSPGLTHRTKDGV